MYFLLTQSLFWGHVSFQGCIEDYRRVDLILTLESSVYTFKYRFFPTQWLDFFLKPWEAGGARKYFKVFPMIVFFEMEATDWCWRSLVQALGGKQFQDEPRCLYWGSETTVSKSVESTEKAFLHETKQLIHVFFLQSSRQWGCFYEDGSFRNLHDCRRRKEHSVKRFTVNHHIFSTEKFKLHNVPRDLEKQNFSWRSLVSQTYRTRSIQSCFLWFGFVVIFSLCLGPGEIMGVSALNASRSLQ